jgi:hypothetical protein
MRHAFSPRRALSGHGELIDPLPDSRPIALSAIDRATASPEHPAGLYVRGAMQRAINIAQAGEAIVPIGGLPSGVVLRSLTPSPATALAPFAFAAALILFLLDCLAALMLSGQWRRLRRVAQRRRCCWRAFSPPHLPWPSRRRLRHAQHLANPLRICAQRRRRNRPR